MRVILVLIYVVAILLGCFALYLRWCFAVFVNEITSLFSVNRFCEGCLMGFFSITMLVSQAFLGLGCFCKGRLFV